MYPKLFSIGNITIHTYGLFVAIGFLAGIYLAEKLASYRSLSRDFVSYIVTGCLITGLIGARLVYVLISLEEYSGDILRIFMFWEGGLVFWGGILGGAAWVVYAALKMGYNVWSVGDVLAPGIALGHAIGRIGCFFAGCCYGKPTDLWCGIGFGHPETLAQPIGVQLHPTQLYSSIFLFLLSFILYRKLKSKKSRSASVFALYLIIFGIFRIIIENFRGDYRGLPFIGITPTQWIAIAGIILGIFLIKKSRAYKVG
jgi:phosphatidylglycerol:prolipoprotein diacylglycerol transferase